MVRRVGFEGRIWHTGRHLPTSLLGHYRQRKSEPDLLLAMGGDLHIPWLHQDPEAKRVWEGLACPRLCLSYESLRDSLWPESRTKFQSSLEIFTHYAVCDEVDEAWVSAQGRPARWIPQGVDVDAFRPRGQKKPGIFFRGKFLEYDQYAPRRRLLEGLAGAGLVEIISRELREDAYRNLYRRSSGVLNPRGVFGGYNVRTFEALASGCVLFQQEIPRRPRNASLLRPGVDAVLLPGDEKECAEILASTDWASFPIRRMAQQGPHLARARHSLEDRLACILEWVGESSARPALLAGARILREQIDARVIAEGNPTTAKDRWKRARRMLYRVWPESLGLSHRKKMLGLASANRAQIRNPTRLQQDQHVHRRLLRGQRGGKFRLEGSSLAAGNPALYLKKFWGWEETRTPGVDMLCRRGPEACQQNAAPNAKLLVLDNFHAQPLPDLLTKKFRPIYAESDQEYLVAKK